MCTETVKLTTNRSAKLRRKLTVVFLFTQVLKFGCSKATPEDLVAAAPFGHFSGDDSRADTFTSAYLNVTFLTRAGWKWDMTDVGRYGGGYIVLKFGCSEATPEDLVGPSPLGHFPADESWAGTFTSAYLNVSFLTDDGWKWDKSDVGRYGGGYIAPSPEELVSGSTFRNFSTDVNGGDIWAYLNVSLVTADGWTWDKPEVGRFGGGFIGPARGELVHVSSRMRPEEHTGCQLPFASSRSDGELPPPGTPWIALIKRGRCNFEVKVENAFKSKAVGVLVYNDRDSASLDKMKLSSDSRRNISAVFIYKWKGEELASKLENNSKVFVHITIAGYTTSRTANINRTSVLFVSITFIVLMIISLTWLVFYYVQRFRYIRTKDKLSKRLDNAAKKAVSKIPTKNLKSEDKEVQSDLECCAICIEHYKLSEVLRILPCGHEFHKNCIDPWLLEHRTCPMCKMDILKHYGFVFTGSQESILQIDSDSAGQVSLGSQGSSPRRGGISPLPEIRAVISDRQMPRFFDNSVDEDSSRASTPDEMTPSLLQRAQFPVRQELCVGCIAAKEAAANHHMNNLSDKEASTSADSDVRLKINTMCFSINSDNDKKVQNSTKRNT